MSDSTNTDKSESAKKDSAGTQANTPLPIINGIENAWRECEARLQILRSDIEKLRTNAASGIKPATIPNDTKIQQVLDILTGLSKDPFWLIERDLAHAQKEGHANQKPDALPPASETPSQTNNVPPVPKASRQDPSASNSTDSALFGDNPNIIPDDPMQQAATDAQSFMQSAVAPVSSPLIPNASSPNFNILPFANPGSDGSQEAQASDDRLRAALEQTTQMTTSLFNEMLSLIDGQNRMLAQVGRKISDLNGQLNSLKNP